MLWMDRSTDVYVELGWPVNQSTRSQERARGEGSRSVWLMHLERIERVALRKEKVLLIAKADDSSYSKRHLFPGKRRLFEQIQEDPLQKRSSAATRTLVGLAKH